MLLSKGPCDYCDLASSFLWLGPRYGSVVEAIVMTEKHLLIVDDEPDFCNFVALVGEGIGYRVSKVTDPLRFADAYRKDKPDCIVIDMVMPSLDGFELLKWLVSEKSSAKILIVTGHNPHYAKAAQLQSVAKGLSQVKTFTKPISVSKLRAALS